MRIQKSDYNGVFYNILYKYTNTFNNSKLLKMIFIKKKGKYYNKLNYYYKKYI